MCLNCNICILEYLSQLLAYGSHDLFLVIVRNQIDTLWPSWHYLIDAPEFGCNFDGLTSHQVSLGVADGSMKKMVYGRKCVTVKIGMAAMELHVSHLDLPSLFH